MKEAILKPTDPNPKRLKKGWYSTTENFSSIMGQLRDKKDEQGFNHIFGILKEMINGFQKMQKALSDSPESWAWNWNREVSEVVDQQKIGLIEQGRTISCKKGCAWCCGQQITITLPEAMLLVGMEKKGEAKIDWEKVEKQSTQDFTPEAFGKLPWELRSCSLLDMEEKTCTAYDNRPGVCRTYYSIDDPIKCKTDVRQEIERFVPYYGEAMVSASWNLCRVGPMPIMLLEAKNLLEVKEGNNASNDNTESNEDRERISPAH